MPSGEGRADAGSRLFPPGTQPEEGTVIFPKDRGSVLFIPTKLADQGKIQPETLENTLPKVYYV